MHPRSSGFPGLLHRSNFTWREHPRLCSGFRRSLVVSVLGLLLGLLPAQAGLIGFYSFDNASMPLRDDSGNGYDLLTGVGLTDPQYVAGGGVQGGAYTYDGGQHWVAPIDINAGSLPSLTMGAWVKTSSLSSGLRKVMGHDDGGYDRVLGLDDRNGGFRYAAFIGTGDPPPGGPAPKSTDDWTFLAVTYDDWTGQMTLYVDLDTLTIGDALQVSSSPASFGGGQTMVAIGSLRPDNLDEGWQGSIDNVFFYDEVLTLQQLTDIRDGGKGAILGTGGEDPDFRITSVPALRGLAKSPAVQTFSFGIKNLGTAQPLTISSVTAAGADAGRYAVTAFPATLAPGATGTIEFTFNSQGQVGAYTATLLVACNDPTTPAVSLDASAQVGDDPDLAIVSAPNLQDLPKLPQVQTLAFTVRNDGAFDTLTISQITISGADSSHYAVTSYPATLLPGATGTIEVTFDNMGQVGSFAATASIQSNDASTPTTLYDLSARVTGNALLGFYSFDDGAAPTKDDSGNGRTLRSIAAALDPTYDAGGGVTGGGYLFDGGQRWEVPLDINPSAVPILTMGAWVRPVTSIATLPDPGLYKVMGHDNGGWDRVIGLDTRNGGFCYSAFTGNGVSVGNPALTPLGPDQWTFLAAVYDQPSSQLTLYVDVDVSSLGDNPEVVSHTATLGTGAATAALGAIAPSGGEGWVGYIDNAFFLGGRIDASTVKAVRDGGKTALLTLRPDPVLSISPDPVFGDLPGPAPVTASIALRNTGQTQPLVIRDARITGRDATRYTLADVPATIAAGATATMKVTFNPQGREGPFAAALDLISNSTADRHAVFDLSAFVPYSTPLIAFYPFDDPWNPLQDATGKGADLIAPLGAAPTYQPAGGVEGGAYAFNGAQRLVSAVNINPARLPQLTMGAWVRTDSLATGLRKVMGHDDGGWDRTIGLDNRDDGTFRYTSFVGNGAPLPGGDTPPTPTSTNAWTFLAATYDQDSSYLALYVDLDVATRADPLMMLESTTTGFGAGQSTTAIGDLSPANASEGWQGSIDNAFFYQTVLTVEELTAIRDGGAQAIFPVVVRPQITGIQRTTNVTLTWTSVAGKTYVVEYTDNLSAAWTQVATPLGMGATTSFTDADATRMARPVGFYRVGVQP